MKTERMKNVEGYCILLAGVLLAPFLPFFFLLIPAFLAVFLSAPVAAVVFSLLLDSFLLLPGMPVWETLTGWTVLALLLVALVKNTTTL